MLRALWCGADGQLSPVHDHAVTPLPGNFSNQGVGMLWIEPALQGGANLLVNISGDNARMMKSFNDRQVADQVLRVRPDLPLVVLDHSGHCPHDEVPEAFNGALLGWLEGLGGQGMERPA